jgi:GNAT superfamily N-acetyltransferase
VEITVRRTAGRADEELSLALANEVWPQHAVTMDEVDSFKASTLAHADHIAFVGTEPAGSGFVAIQPQRPSVALALVTVLPRHRRRGVGTALYRELSRWCGAQGIDAIEARVEEDDEESLGYAGRRGFAEIERNGRMVLDLAGLEPSAVAPPAGVEIVSWAAHPDLARGIYDVAVEAYADVPGAEDEEMEPFEDWLAHDMQGSGDRPEATFVARVGDEVIGYAKFSLTAAQPKVAFHDMTGVKRAWRGRGVAGALKRAQIRWAKEQGYERLETGNEMRNEPIRRLNARLGYREAPGRVLMRGPLASASGR